jgi:hypothetical protein
MQIDTQVLRLREYKQTNRAAQGAPPGDPCRFVIPSIRRVNARGGTEIQAR